MALTRREVLKAGAGALLLPLAQSVFAKPQPGKSFRVVFFSDTHVAVGRNLTENRAMLEEIAALGPAFCINGGDITDQGWRDQIDLYQGLIKTLNCPVHHCPGNHDVRWSPLGIQIFEEYFGKPYRAFEHEGCWFIMLNTTVPLSHWGTIDAPQLTWLKRTLKGIGRSAPILVFGHHWIGREDAETQQPLIQVDNEFELIQLLRDYNVKFVGNGHGHNDLRWDVEGIFSVMNKGLYQLSYTVLEIDVARQMLRVLRRSEKSPSPVIIGEVDLRLNSKEPDWKFDPSDLSTVGDGGSIRVDGGPWKPTKEAVLTFGAVAGYHDVYARKSGKQEVRRATISYVTDGLSTEWEREISGGVMSHLVLDGKELFVSGMDGAVHCLAADDGEVIWKAQTGAYCHSSPVVAGDHVYVGSADGHLYALARTSGRIVWKRKLPGPVYASAAFAQDTVFIANVGAFFGLDPVAGHIKWKTEMPNSNTPFSQSVAATDGEVFIQGCWDSHLYALEAETGNIRWRNPCQERTFAFSPAIGSPTIAEAAVYVVANGNGLFKFEISSGRKIWEVASPAQKYGHSGPCVVGDRVFAGNLGDGEGEVRCVSAGDGKEIWMARTGLTIYDSCARAGDDFIVVNSVPGVVNVLRQSDGKVLSKFRMGQGHALSTCAVKGRQIYCSSFANHIFALKV